MSSSRAEDADQIKREQRQHHRRRVSAVMGVFVACLGVMSFFRVAGNPRFETIHTLDMIGLMTAGAGIAAGLVLLIQFFCLPDPRSEDNRAGQEQK